MPATFSIYFDESMRRKVSITAAILGVSAGELVRRACHEKLDALAQNPAIAAHLDLVPDAL